MSELLDWFLHIDEHLQQVTSHYRGWTYAILFGIIFCETGLVVTPILPGDSLLFAAGYVASLPDSAINVWLLCLVLTIAAVLGDTVNYHIGKYLGPRVMSGKFSRWLNPKHLEKTERFFEKYGAKTIILARFIPIVRTFAPFVAGIGSMNYRRFLAYNVVGGVLWVFSMTLAGYWFGRFEIVKQNFELVVIAIVVLSILPAVIEYLRHRFAKPAPSQPEANGL
ncbi:MAG: DedA family protein [Pirellulaceae bacterium]